MVRSLNYVSGFVRLHLVVQRWFELNANFKMLTYSQGQCTMLIMFIFIFTVSLTLKPQILTVFGESQGLTKIRHFFPLETMTLVIMAIHLLVVVIFQS